MWMIFTEFRWTFEAWDDRGRDLMPEEYVDVKLMPTGWEKVEGRFRSQPGLVILQYNSDTPDKFDLFLSAYKLISGGVLRKYSAVGNITNQFEFDCVTPKLIELTSNDSMVCIEWEMQFLSCAIE